MNRHPLIRTCRRFGRHLHRVLMCMAAVVLVLQGAAAGAFTALGPAHVHKVEATPLVLADSRRWKPSAPGASGFYASLGHDHTARSQRHHHAFDDPSVVRTGDDGRLSGADVDDGLTAGASLASVLALLPDVVLWNSATMPGVLQKRPSWAMSTGFAERLDRPPQRA